MIWRCLVPDCPDYRRDQEARDPYAASIQHDRTQHERKRAVAGTRDTPPKTS